MKWLGVVGAVVFTSVFAGTALAAGSGLIPCNGYDCTVDDFFKLMDNIIKWVLMIMVPIGAIGFAVAGFYIMFSGGDTGRVNTGKQIMWGILWGMLAILFAYLLIETFKTVFV